MLLIVLTASEACVFVVVSVAKICQVNVRATNTEKNLQYDLLYSFEYRVVISDS